METFPANQGEISCNQNESNTKASCSNSLGEIQAANKDLGKTSSLNNNLHAAGYALFHKESQLTFNDASKVLEKLSKSSTPRDNPPVNNPSIDTSEDLLGFGGAIGGQNKPTPVKTSGDPEHQNIQEEQTSSQLSSRNRARNTKPAGKFPRQKPVPKNGGRLSPQVIAVKRAKQSRNRSRKFRCPFHAAGICNLEDECSHKMPGTVHRIRSYHLRIYHPRADGWPKAIPYAGDNEEDRWYRLFVFIFPTWPPAQALPRPYYRESDNHGLVDRFLENYALDPALLGSADSTDIQLIHSEQHHSSSGMVQTNEQPSPSPEASSPMAGLQLPVQTIPLSIEIDNDHESSTLVTSNEAIGTSAPPKLYRVCFCPETYEHLQCYNKNSCQCCKAPKHNSDEGKRILVAAFRGELQVEMVSCPALD